MDRNGIKCKSCYSIFYIFYISIFQVLRFGGQMELSFLSNLTYNGFPKNKTLNIINQTIFDVKIESDLVFNRDKNVGRG